MDMVPNHLDLVGHLAYTLIFFSFLVKRILWLRGLAIVASCFAMFYSYNISDQPLWVQIQWNCVFILTNLVHIGLIFKEKMNIKLNDDENFLQETLFPNFSNMELRKLMNLGFTRTEQANKILVKAGIKPTTTFALIEGEVSIVVDGQEVATMEAGSFIGEMGFLTENLTTADVICKDTTRFVFWDNKELEDSLYKNPHLLHRFEGAIGKQLINQIVKQNEKTSEEKRLKLVS